MYKQGLKLNVKQELMRTGAAITTLEELINEFIKLNNKLYELYKETWLDTTIPVLLGKVNKETINWNYQLVTNKNRTWLYKPANNWHDPDAMEINNLTKGPVWSNKKNGSKERKDKDTRLCYNCGKIGYISRNCWSPKARQMNVLGGPELDEEIEWEIILAGVRRLMKDEPDTSDTDEEDFKIYTY